jgi:hypothetical protein
MTTVLLKLFRYLPAVVTDHLNLFYNKLVYRKQTRENISVWSVYKEKLSPELARAFRALAVYETSPSRFKDYIEGYTSDDFGLINGELSGIRENGCLIMMCAVKDDLARVQYQYNKMKKYGVKNFVYIDNGSTDGTKEWLREREDVVLYCTNQRFNSTIKSSWYRRVVDSIGYDRWYLYLDSDEVYLYPGIEEDKFSGLLSFLGKERISAVKSILLDLYPKYTVNLESTSEKIDLDEYDHFDPVYRVRHYRTYDVFYGGPRYRKFGRDSDVVNWLNKTNLVYYKRDFFQYAHYLVPYSLNLKARVLGATAHYKFLPSDFDRFVRIAEAGTYARNSEEYKKYIAALEDTKSIRFFCKESVHLKDSNALTEVNVLDRKLIHRIRQV